MKKILVIATLALASMGAFAQATGAAVQGQTTAVDTQSVAQAVNQGLSQGVTLNIEAAKQRDVDRVISDSTQRINYDNAQVIRNTPSVSGPSLTTSNDTCMGSTSGSVNIAGLGVGGGTTWVDTDCKRLKNARELWNMGMKGAGVALLCEDTANRKALELTGYVCPQSMTSAELKKAYGNQARTASEGDGIARVPAANEPTDPLIRKRIGLPPISTIAMQ